MSDLHDPPSLLHPKNPKGLPMRVYAWSKVVPEDRGYVGIKRIYGQELQMKTRHGWETIDREEVPADVKISMGCFGDTGGWVSKFVVFGTFGRDGILHSLSPVDVSA